MLMSVQKEAPAMRYEFGKNWSEFIEQSFNEERLDLSREQMLRFLKLPNLNGKTFVDLGCGSGLHSLAAWRAGAERIVSFDFDPNSVATTEKLWNHAGRPDHWTIQQGSVLDRSFLDNLPRADITYSWGVLHHTGAMWDAIANAATVMKDDGVFFIALYCTDVYVDPPAQYWLRVKEKYNRAGGLKRRFMEWTYAWRTTIRPALRSFRNPFKELRDYKQSRGMSYWTDVKDWLGGWPMEFAGIAETKAFCGSRLDLELLNINAGEGNTEYLFRRNGAKNYWDAIRQGQRRVALSGPFTHVDGNCWQAKLATEFSTPSTSADASLMVYENDTPVGFARQSKPAISRLGAGRYRHEGPDLFFSSTDNSNPNENGRRYAVCLDS